MDYPGYSWTAGSRKHRVSRSQARTWSSTRGCTSSARRSRLAGRTALLFVGDDAHGTKLEVVGVELADGRLRVLHAMPMRPGYEPLYQEAHRWRQ